MTPPRRIALPHSTQAVVPAFDTAARALGVAVAHTVRDDLLLTAEAAGEVTAEIRARTSEAPSALAPAADAVRLTRSTLGPAVEGTGAIRVGAALACAVLARKPGAGGGRRVALCAAATTPSPARGIFVEAGAADAAIRLVPGAWAAFRAGGTARYHAPARAATDQALEVGAACVALAQASMAGAAAGDRRILASPEAGPRAAAGLAP